MIRRAILAFALMAGLAPVLAQAPPPVPALPDTERRTSYSITGTTCACAVNFAIFGDSTDYQNWVEVYLNGIRVNFNDPTFGWTITSPSNASLATAARPITDAVLTFNSVQTGTVQIVGARRPRRLSQFTEGRGVAARDLNQVLTDIIAQNREVWDKTNDVTGRALLSQPGNTLGLLPLPSVCAGKLLSFDVTGLIPQCSSPLPIVANTITNTLLAQMPAGTVKANPTGATATPTDWAIHASNSVQGTGITGLDGGQWYVFQGLTSITNSDTSILGQRNITGGAIGTFGTTHKAVWGFTAAQAVNEQAFEWAVVGELHNQVNVSTGAQNLGVNGTAFKETPTNTAATTATSGTGTTATVTFSGGATIPVGHSVTVAGVTPSGYNGTYKVTASSAGSVSFANATTGAQTVAGTIVDTSIGPTWGGNFQCKDTTSEPDPISSCIGVETDVFVSTATTDANKQRVAQQITAQGVSGAHVGIGILLNNNPGVIIDNALFTPSGVLLGAGINFSAATFTGNAFSSPGFSVDSSGNLAANNVTTAWSNFTPSPACGNATFTTTAAHVETAGKWTRFSLDITISGIGTTCANTANVTFTLPTTTAMSASFAARNGAVGYGITCSATGSTNLAACTRYDGTNPWALNDRLIVTGSYENL